jgi:hypothetical protein
VDEIGDGRYNYNKLDVFEQHGRCREDIELHRASDARLSKNMSYFELRVESQRSLKSNPRRTSGNARNNRRPRIGHYDRGKAKRNVGG